MYNTRVYIYVCVLCVLCTSSYAYYARSTYELVVDIIRGSILASTYYSRSILVQYSVNILGSTRTRTRTSSYAYSSTTSSFPSNRSKSFDPHSILGGGEKRW